jgi:hypothetical protein
MKHKALQALRPEAEWVLRGDELEWLDTVQTEPTAMEIAAKEAELIADYEAQEYARSRAKAYPSIGDQLDALYHAGSFPDNMAAEILAVKNKYPKG